MVIKLDNPLHHVSIVELKRVLASSLCSPTVVVGHLLLRHGRLYHVIRLLRVKSNGRVISIHGSKRFDRWPDHETYRKEFYSSLIQLDYCSSMASEGLPVICQTMEESHMPCYLWQEHVHSCSFPLGVTCHAICDTVFSTFRWDGRFSLTFSVDCPLPD